ncbi:TonB-dependent receptor [Flammeovirgaceae bacterium SG7u.111]|nr:TonB-dependent receptor [Flammeovirgaceae bacterium SG7u.132]WPO34894.1 TonB-dependent receptor [Flammeovirgaceae bacterium SG7u.111]
MEKKFLPRNQGWGIELKKALLLSCTVIMFAFTAKSQATLISGTITDANDGAPLVGATVLIKGTTQGVVTDLDGNFKLQVEKGKVLLVSFIGFVTQEIEVGSQTFFEITMASDALSLDEIVVVGYGEQKKENLSGAVDAIDKQTLASRPIQTLAQGLQGISPNLNIDYLSGEPGTAPNFNIRGFTSINGGQPLIIVDGVPMDAREINTISPNDVENISVLKDASSAAIYGARAAYGVILITTKTKSTEGVSLSYSNNFSWNKPTVLPNKVTDPYIYLRVRETSTDNTPWDNQNYSDQTYQYAKEKSDNPSTPSVRENPTAAGQWEYMGDKDWTKEFLEDMTFSQQHNLSIGARGEKTSFLLSTSYDDQEGIIDNIAPDRYKRYSFRSKVDYQVFDWLKLGNNTSLAFTERTRPTYFKYDDPTTEDDDFKSVDEMWQIYNFHPNDWDINPDGSFANTEVGIYKAQLKDGGLSTNKLNIYQTAFTGEMSFFDRALRINSDFTIRKNIDNNDIYQTKYKIGYGPGDIREQGNSWALRTNAENTYTVFNIYTTVTKSLGDHNLSAIAGYNQEENKYEYFYSQKTNLVSSAFPTVALATGEVFLGESIREWAVQGAFFRANYNYKDKYIVEFNGRYDGSSKFPSDKRWGFFPSASAAWRIDSESFFEPIINTVNQFKLRASYGTLGNQFVDEYDYIPTMNPYVNPYIIGDSRPLAISSPQIVSANYAWEKVNTLNFGVDLGLFGNRLTAVFDIYKRETLDMLTLGKELPSVLGTSEPLENAADLETKGWEFTLGYQDQFLLADKPFKFSTRFILSDSKTKVTKFDNPNRSLPQYYEGMEIGEIWGLQSDGLFQSEDEIAELDQTDIIPWGALNIVPGWPKYVDADGNGRIEKGATVDEPKDLSVIGNLQPRLRYGVDLSFNWSNFDMRVFFQGVAKRDFYPRHYLYWGFYQQPYAGGYEHLLDYYRGSADSDVDRAKHSQAYIDAGLADANTDSKYPVLQSWLADRNLGERIDQAQGLAIPQTDYLLDGSYLRLKNLTIGYTLPNALTQRAKISNLRIYVSGENLAEWSELKDFYDPEAINDDVRKYDPSRSTESGWGYSYPLQRRYSMGLSVNF